MEDWLGITRIENAPMGRALKVQYPDGKEVSYTYGKGGERPFVTYPDGRTASYLYDSRLRLAGLKDGEDTITYEYNGLGHRVGKASGAMEGMAGMQNGVSGGILKGKDVMDPLSRLKEQTVNPETRIGYTIDLTRQYHNLLQKLEGETTQSYLWDGNVAGMREDRGTASHYYLQDELGSPIRLMDKNGELAESYGYDEFGQELYGNREGTVGRSMTGSIQPFGYTGYQYDKTAGTYYAQAREYRAEQGRFAAVDTIKGFTAAPYTLNEYGYCWNNPMVLVDRDGRLPEWLENIGETVGEGWDALCDYTDKAVETVKNVASDIKGAATEFYNENKEVIDTITKVTITIGIGTIAVLGGVAIACVAAESATLAVSAGLALGAQIVSFGILGGVIGGISNSITGSGSFLNGFCGGFANGCISGVGIVTYNPIPGCIIGGFVGNEITENFNNMDNPQNKKGQLGILFTSAAMGAIQGILNIGPIGSLSNGAGFAKGTLLNYIAKFFGKDLEFMISNNSSILINEILDFISSREEQKESECVGVE